MEPDGKIYRYFDKYSDDRYKLKLMVNEWLSEKAREERIAMKSAISSELSKYSEKKLLANDKFTKLTAGFTASDQEYCDKMRVDSSHYDFMTDEDLLFEEKKLQKMLAVIKQEKESRALAPKIKVFKNVVSFINRLDNIAESDNEDCTPPDHDNNPPRNRSPRRVSTSSSSSSSSSSYSSSVVRTILAREPSEPSGMSIVATPATAVRMADVEEQQEEDII